jgi:hypothetical protein
MSVRVFIRYFKKRVKQTHGAEISVTTHGNGFNLQNYQMDLDEI